MAANDEIIEPPAEAIIAAADSDYGSDLDDDAWDHVFSPKLNAVQTVKSAAAIEDIEDAVLPARDDELDETPARSLRLGRTRASLEKAIARLGARSAAFAGTSAGERVAYDDGEEKAEDGAAAQTSESPVEQQNRRDEKSETVETASQSKDLRSPIERFRSPPKRSLSVTDLVSPAWCELQYWYSLSRYGRIRRTPAMKAGTKIHKEKEAEVHTQVPVDVVTKEDRLGLRIWNIIHGLRTLRRTGLTRELEVWGVVDGEVVVGIIDELTETCPDEQAEARVMGEERSEEKAKALPSDQRTMTEFFASSSQKASAVESQAPPVATLSVNPRRKIYLVDTKTRNSASLPHLGSQMRPTQMQLMMYHRLLTNLASNHVEAERIFNRYNVDQYSPFSDTFIANLSNINIASSQASAAENGEDNDEGYSFDSESRDPLEEILSHTTLSSLWARMIAEFARTIPINPSSSSISPLLTAEFRNSKTAEVIGTRSFAFDAQVLDGYVEEVLRWWRGEREGKGVAVEEAYKCRICEFAEGCTWRTEKVDEALQKARARRMGGDSQSQI